MTATRMAAEDRSPGVARVDLPAAIADAILAHARAGLPNEACGLIAGDAPAARGGRALRWIPTRNALASPYRFEIQPDDLLHASLAIDDAGEVVWAIVHSHVASPARPSASDLREARHPAALHLIVSLAPDLGDAPLRAWSGEGREVELEIA